MNLNKFIAKRNNIVFYTSNDIGVKPILSKINEDMNFYNNADIEDTVVGKAAASLYVLAKIKFVYAHTLSEPAKIYVSTHLTTLGILQSSSRGILVHGITNHLSSGYARLHNIILNPIHDRFAVSVVESPFEFRIV